MEKSVLCSQIKDLFRNESRSFHSYYCTPLEQWKEISNYLIGKQVDLIDVLLYERLSLTQDHNEPEEMKD